MSPAAQGGMLHQSLECVLDKHWVMDTFVGGMTFEGLSH